MIKMTALVDNNLYEAQNIYLSIYQIVMNSFSRGFGVLGFLGRPEIVDHLLVPKV